MAPTVPDLHQETLHTIAFCSVNLCEISRFGKHGAPQIPKRPALKLDGGDHHIVRGRWAAELFDEGRDSADRADQMDHESGLTSGIEQVTFRIVDLESGEVVFEKVEQSTLYCHKSSAP